MANKNFMRPRGDRGREPQEFEERVIEVDRVSRVVKGGRRMRFRALVILGNKKGKVGMGIAKANDVSEAVRKAVAQAKKHIVEIPIIGGTIPYEITAKYGGARIMLKPATSGTSIVAGGSVRAVCEIAGITDLLSKIMGSANKVNNVTATIKALSSFNPRYISQVKTFDENKTNRAAVKQAEPASVEVKTAEEKVEKNAPEKTVKLAEPKTKEPETTEKVKKALVKEEVEKETAKAETKKESATKPVKKLRAKKATKK